MSAPVTARTMASMVPKLGKMSRKQLALVIGVAPFNHDSGSHRGKRHIRGGRSAVRHVLYTAALAAIKYNPTVREVYDRLLIAGKLPKVAIVACMCRLLSILNAMVRDQKPWHFCAQPI